ncbi:MAG TPA: hypothetical protein VKH37_09420, partial [Ferruginibacter sp.]|nr:hypothetical protein [Ferruginibacter sp.]
MRLLTLSIPGFLNHLSQADKRMVMMGVTKDQWPHYVAEMDRILKPGGWVQCSETTFPMWDEGTLPDDSNYVKVFHQEPGA